MLNCTVYKKVVIFIKISEKNEKLLLYLRIFYIFSGFLRDSNKKGTFQRVKCFVVGGPQLFASF